MRRWLRPFLIFAAITPAFGLQAQQPDMAVPANQSAEIANALAKFHGRPLVLVFAPGLWGDYCKQSAELASHAASLHNRRVVVAWLLSHDAGQKTCDFSNSINDVEFEAGRPSGSRQVFHYFNAPENEFSFILLNKHGKIVLRSSKPVRFAELRTALDAPTKKE